MSFTARSERERREQFVDTILRGTTRIFRPEVYKQVFPPTQIERLMEMASQEEGEEITPDDFDSIDQFIRGLGEVKSSVLSEDEGWI